MPLLSQSAAEHLLSPAHSRTLHSILDEILSGALHAATNDGPTLGKIFVIAAPLWCASWPWPTSGTMPTYRLPHSIVSCAPTGLNHFLHAARQAAAEVIVLDLCTPLTTRMKTVRAPWRSCARACCGCAIHPRRCSSWCISAAGLAPFKAAAARKEVEPEKRLSSGIAG